MVEFRDLQASGALVIDTDVVINLTTTFQTVLSWQRKAVESPGTLTAPAIVPDFPTGELQVNWPLPNDPLGLSVVIDGGMYGPNNTDVRLQLERSFNGGAFLPLSYASLTLTGPGDVIDFIGTSLAGTVASAQLTRLRLRARSLAGTPACTFVPGTRFTASRIFVPSNAIITLPP